MDDLTLRRRQSGAGAACVLLSLLATLALTPLGGNAQALVDGSIEAGKARSVTCAACHGADGNSFNPVWPSLAGQHATYIVASLQAYKTGKRNNVLMTAQAMPLSEQEMKDLAVYFSAQTMAPKTADPELVTEGERLYRGGDKDTGIPACIACHGPTGRGNIAAAWPAVAGQHAPYTAAQLEAYRSNQRTSDGDTQMMRNVTSRMSDDQIRAVSSYIQGLR